MKFAICNAAAVMILTVPVVTGIAQSTNGISGSYKIEKTLLGPWDRALETQPFYVGAPDRTPGCSPVCGLAGLGFAIVWDAAVASSRPVYILSSDRLHFAYISINKHVCGERLRICLVVDGQVETTPDVKRMGYLSFASDDKRFTYKVEGKDGQWSVVTLALENDRWMPVVDGQVEPADQPSPILPSSDPRPAPSSLGPVSSPDGTRTASVVWKRGWNSSRVVVDGRASAGYGEIGNGSLTFSPDSKHLAFTALKTISWVVVVDGRESRKYDKVGLPIFSPDSGHVAFTARTKHITKPWTVIVDDRECGNFEEVGVPGFSRDGRHVAFVASTRINKNKWSVVVDNETGEEFDGLIWGSAIFDAHGAVEYLAHTGDSLYRIRYVPTQ